MSEPSAAEFQAHYARALEQIDQLLALVAETRRDVLAAAALTGLIIITAQTSNITRDELAAEAFAYADAMIAASKTEQAHDGRST